MPIFALFPSHKPSWFFTFKICFFTCQIRHSQRCTSPMKISGSIFCKMYWFGYGKQERTRFMENEYSEIREDATRL